VDIHTIIVLATFAAVYLGMAAGRWPGLAIDRTGIALCGAILILFVQQPGHDVLKRIDFATLAILFGLMVLSAQFAVSGFYDWCATRLATSRRKPHILLALVIATTGGLSSILANDIVVFAMTPILCQGLLRTGRDPRPYLFGLAGAANVGSAATLVGNPQNILIGEHGVLDFWDYLTFAGPLSLAGLVLVYARVAAVWRHSLFEPIVPRPASGAPEAATLDRSALVKGVVTAACLLALYVTDLPRWMSTLLIAGVLLISRRLSTREMLASIDWHLLVLFGSLFVVTGSLAGVGLDGKFTDFLAGRGLSFESMPTTGIAALAGSNTVGNVPFVILALSVFSDLSTPALYGLAVLSTFAGNLLVVGSLANLIVAERCRTQGVAFRFIDHLRAGAPMTLLTMATALAWLQIL